MGAEVACVVREGEPPRAGVGDQPVFTHDVRDVVFGVEFGKAVARQAFRAGGRETGERVVQDGVADGRRGLVHYRQCYACPGHGTPRRIADGEGDRRLGSGLHDALSRDDVDAEPACARGDPPSRVRPTRRTPAGRSSSSVCTGYGSEPPAARVVGVIRGWRGRQCPWCAGGPARRRWPGSWCRPRRRGVSEYRPQSRDRSGSP